ncbi:MAG: stalk domain-containing protein [bacterium]
MKKKIKNNLMALALVSACMLSLGSVSDVLASSRVVKLQIGSTTAYTNGVASTLDAVPFQDSSWNTMVPVRFIATALGVSDDNITYDSDTQEVTIINGNTTITFTVGDTQLAKTTITQSGNSILNSTTYSIMTTPAVIIDWRTFVPLRTVSEAFGVEVGWDEDTKTVTLTDNASSTSANNTTVSLEDLLNFSGVDMNFSFPTGTQIVTSQPQTQIVTSQPQTQIIQTQMQTQVVTSKPTTQATTQVTTEATTQTTTQQTTTNTTSSDTSTARQYEEEVVRLVNIERAKEGLSPLEIDETAMSLARAKSQDMVDRNYFSHEDPADGSYMYYELKTYFWTIAENIAYGQRTPETVVESWMNSEGHKANILTADFKYIGVGFVDYKWTQMFGSAKR